MKKLNKYFVFVFAVLAILFVANFINGNVALAAIANISKIVFTTKSQDAVSVNDLSKIISVQAQDSLGNKQVFDDGDGVLNISSDSPTGQFFSNTSASEVISSLPINNKAWAGRNFYYKDQTIGTHMITVILDANGKSWTATQDITIGSSTSDVPIIPIIPDATGTIPIASTTPVTYGGGGGGYVSCTYAAEEVSDYVEPTSFEVSAGRERLSYVNFPVSFAAKKKMSTDLKNGTPSYTWSFGDGSSATTEKAVHTYKYPGEYNVVLNANLDGYDAVGRTRVKVLTPELSLAVLTDGAVKISNSGKYEINLYGATLQAGNLAFAFPLDTIISAGQKVVFPATYLKFSTLGNLVSLLDTTAQILAQVGVNSFAGNSVTDSQAVSTADFERFVAVYREIIKPEVKPEVKSETDIPLSATVADTFVTATTSADQATAEPGFWSKLFHPIRTIQNAFYR